MDARVGVVVVNYNGGELTLRCLRSLLATDWPPSRFQVVLVDNASLDGIPARVRTELPAVKVVESPSNRGFAGGCNMGFAHLTDVDHVALVNNDATVAPHWLRPLSDVLREDPSIGAASPKILFATSFVDIRLTSKTRRRGLGDRRPLGVQLSGVRVDGADGWRSMQFVCGFWGPEGPAGSNFQWTNGDALLRVPARPDRSPPATSLRLAADVERTVTITSGPHHVDLQIGTEASWYDVPVGGEPGDVINNVGSVMLRGGYGADRGYLERDEGQYEHREEVFAWCGAAVLLSRRYLDQVGVFDERFFLYYEDFDLSWRGRAQGWRHVYVPGPPVRHVHSASTVQESRLHHHYGERNRLLTLVRNAPASMALRAAVHHLLVTGSYARRDVFHPVVHGKPPSWETVHRRLRAFGAFLTALPPTLVSRRRIRRRRVIPDETLLCWQPPAFWRADADRRGMDSHARSGGGLG